MSWMSGAAGDTGFDYQADVFAGVAPSMLSASPLLWFDDFDDTPIAISLESDGPGDDLRIETPDGVIEVQAKHGLRRDDRFSKAVCRLFSGLLRDENLRAVLFVDSTSSGPIRNYLRQDVRKIAGGRSDSLHQATEELLHLFKEKGLECDEAVFARFRVVVGDYDDGSGDMRACVRQLEGILPNSQDARICWDELGKEGHRLTRNRGRRDRASLLKMLRQKLSFAIPSTDLIPATEYFASYLEPGRLFHHYATLVGRKRHLADLRKFESGGNQIGLLIGRGGIGKSKIIFEFTRNAECGCWYLQSESGVDPQALRLIPDRNALVIIEDGHRLPRLKSIIRSIRSMRPEVKILLSARSHSKEHVVSTIVDAGVDVSKIFRFDEVKELTRSEVEELSAAFFPDDLELAATLARTTWDCPLVTVVAAELIRQNDLPPSLLVNDRDFRDAVLSRLKEQFLSDAKSPVAANLRSALLNLIAALAPVDLSNQPLIERMAHYLSVSVHDLRREIGHLTESGILIRRESRVRITPDVLSDHVLHSACSDHTGTLTGYADEIFSRFGQSSAAVILNNLAELDWRLQSSQTNPPSLLSDIIGKLTTEFHDSSFAIKTELLEVLTEAAYYIPETVLPMLQTFVECCEHVGASSMTSRTIEVATACLRRTSYTMELVSRSLDLLWRLHKLESPPRCTRDENRCDEVIKDIAKYEVRKPYEYTTASVEAMARAVNIAADEDVETAFEVIDEVLTKTPLNIYHHNNRFVTRTFVVQRNETEVARNAALELLFIGLRDGDPRRKLRCIESLANALRIPLGPMGLKLTESDRDQWVPEQIRIVKDLQEYLPHAEPLVVTQIVEAVSWHVLYERRPPLVTAARDVARSVVDSFELRFFRSILRNIDADWACDYVDAPIPVDHELLVEGMDETEQEFAKSVAAEFVRLFPVATSGARFLHDQLAKCQAGNVDVNMHTFLWYVADFAHDYAADLAELIIERSDLQYGFVKGIRSLTEPVARLDRSRGIRQLKLLADACGAWRIEAANTLAYSDWFDAERDETVVVLRDLMTDTTPEAVQAVTSAIRRLSRSDLSLGVTLALEYNPPTERKMADEYVGMFCGQYGIAVSELSQKQIDQILAKLTLMPDVDDWHVGQFLNEIAKFDYSRVVQFFIRRSEKEKHSKVRFDPLPSRKYSSLRLDPPTEKQCRDATLTIIDHATNADRRIQYRFSRLLRLLCGDDNEWVLSELAQLLGSGELAKHEVAVRLVGRFGSEFVVRKPDFVCLALEQAETLGSDVVSGTSRAFFSQAVNRMRSGTAGEPFPQDVRLLEGSAAVLDREGICNSARRLYENIRSDVEQDMKRDGWNDEYPL